MKKLLFGCTMAIAGLFTLPAMAQDGCCPSYCNPCCAEAEFDGFYLGGNIGVISHTAHRNDLDGFLTDNSGWTAINTDVTLGAQLGYDWKCGYRVLGLVGDWNWSNASGRVRNEPNDEEDDDFIDSDQKWFATLRGRAGLNICDTLLYITGGAVVSRFETTWQERNDDESDRFHVNDTRWGWTGGFGAEWFACSNWSVGAEFLFFQFSNEKSKTFTPVETGSGPVAFGHGDSAWVGRIVVNYRFGDLCNWCCN